MGRSLSAKIHYGYFLGNDNEGWALKNDTGEDDYGAFPEDAGYDDDYIVEQMEVRLLSSVGFEHDQEYPREDYWSRRREAEKKTGVKIKCLGWEFSDTVLVLRDVEIDAYAGSEVFDRLPHLPADADERLTKAVEALGITPKQEKPSWLLTPCYG